jgi:hypothetical protein
MVYDRQDDEEQSPEHRLGLIADDVKAAMDEHFPAVSNVVGMRHVGQEQMLTLQYDRLVCPLIAKIRALEARITSLELM